MNIEQSKDSTYKKYCSRDECERAGQLLSKDNFYKRDIAKDGLSSWCKQCNNGLTRIFRQKSETKIKRNKQARKDRVAWYGINEDEYNNILNIQNNVCAGCGLKAVEQKKLCIDHKHLENDRKRSSLERRMMIRGLLCDPCNRVVGLVKDDPNILKNLVSYLKNPPGYLITKQNINE